MISKTQKTTNDELTAINKDNDRRFDTIMKLSDWLAKFYTVEYESIQEFENFKQIFLNGCYQDSIEYNHYYTHRLLVYHTENLGVYWTMSLPPLTSVVEISGENGEEYTDIELMRILRSYNDEVSKKIDMPKLITNPDKMDLGLEIDLEAEFESLKEEMSEILMFAYYFE